MVPVTSAGSLCRRMCPGHTGAAALVPALSEEHATLTDVSVPSEVHRTASAQGQAGVGCVLIYHVG